MTDIELIEAAARAIALPHPMFFEANSEDGHPSAYAKLGKCNYWRPLDDDGDALRLAVKLELFDLDKLLVDLDVHDRAASHHLEPLAATRRAIVRAAAAISSSGEREEETR